MPNKLTNEEFIERARAVHGDRYDYSNTTFCGTDKKVSYVCPIHGVVRQRASGHMAGHGCNRCKKANCHADKRGGYANSFFKRVSQEHPQLDFSRFSYLNVSTKGAVICPRHGEFHKTPDSLLRRGGCPRCGIESRTLSVMKTRRERGAAQFENRARAVHGNKYDYSKSVYTGGHRKMTIICPDHGEYLMAPAKHLFGSKCPRCSGKVVVNTKTFVEQAREVHGDRYDYEKAVWRGARSNLTVTCPDHGDFEQSPMNHQSGHGCPVCGEAVKFEMAQQRVLTTSEFVARAKAIHGDTYDYRDTEYTGSAAKVSIVCPACGEFWQAPFSHLAGNGCPGCANYGFDGTAPGRLYYLRVEDRIFGTLYKIGITNRSESTRFRSQDTEKITLIRRWQFDLGAIAQSFETRIKQRFRKSQYRGEPVLTDGNTELFTKDVLGLDPLSAEPRHPVVDAIVAEAEEIPVGDPA